MADFNKVILLGRLTRDPELRYTQSGQALAKIGLAVGRKYFNKSTQQTVEETTYVDCDAWGKQAELLNQYMRKGRPLFIEGRLKFDSWETKDGQRRNKLSVVIDNFQFVDGGGGGGEGGGGGNRESYNRDQAPAPGRGSPQDSPQGSPQGSPQSSPQGSPQGSPQVQAGKVSDSGGGGQRQGGSEEYDFEDIPF